jgi:hypothetical protein
MWYEAPGLRLGEWFSALGVLAQGALLVSTAVRRRAASSVP